MSLFCSISCSCCFSFTLEIMIQKLDSQKRSCSCIFRNNFNWKSWKVMGNQFDCCLDNLRLAVYGRPVYLVKNVLKLIYFVHQEFWWSCQSTPGQSTNPWIIILFETRKITCFVTEFWVFLLKSMRKVATNILFSFFTAVESCWGRTSWFRHRILMIFFNVGEVWVILFVLRASGCNRTQNLK